MTAFFPGKDYITEERCEVSRTMLIPVIVLAALTALAGMFPSALISFFSALAGSLM